MRIELTFPDSRQETTDLKSGTGTSSVTSPLNEKLYVRPCRMASKFNNRAVAMDRQVGKRFPEYSMSACLNAPERSVIDKIYDFLYLGQALINSLSYRAPVIKAAEAMRDTAQGHKSDSALCDRDAVVDHRECGGFSL